MLLFVGIQVATSSRGSDCAAALLVYFHRKRKREETESLREEIDELKAENATIKAENAELRRLLALATAVQNATPAAPKAASPPTVSLPPLKRRALITTQQSGASSARASPTAASTVQAPEAAAAGAADRPSDFLAGCNNRNFAAILTSAASTLATSVC
jgi:hypothetical protein